MSNITLWICVMACITFSMRYAFFVQRAPIKLNRHAKQILIFTAPCVLTAMWAPIVSTNAVTHTTLLDPYFLAGIFTVAASLTIKNTLAVIGLGITLFYVLRYFL